MYHRIGPAHNDWERRYAISPENFAAHMQCLARQGMRACSLGDFFAWLAGERVLPEGSFLLTFDDGFLGVYEHAAPLLQRMNWPATVFLVSRLLGREDEWCRSDNPSGATYPLLAAEHIVAMREMGFTFHSHTRTHADLTTLSDARLAEELRASREDLEALLGEAVPYLAYPYGRIDERVVVAAREAGYRAAFCTQPGFNRRDVHPYRIRRLDVFGTDTPAMLARKVFFGSNDGSWRQTLRYYGERLKARLGASAA
ncbi:MAG TPA: polysaccharide deacetylase family protein [Gammaproteobacteria bacterium]|nr:polysaccharide deacetylase family protein [Gammaproteobacteria bacterium]